LGRKLLLLYVQPGGLGMEITQQDLGAPGQIPGGGLGGQRPQRLKTNVHVNCAYASIKDTNAGGRYTLKVDAGDNLKILRQRCCLEFFELIGT